MFVVLFVAVSLFGAADPAQFSLENQKVNESSGIAASRTYPGHFWTHNDSGDGPFLYLFDGQGRDKGTLALAGVTVADCEDMALAVDDKGRPHLYLGDIGDNLRRRGVITVYRLPEPKSMGKPGTQVVRRFETFTLKYPDRAYDCETLMVHPRTGQAYLVTKSADGISRVYSAVLRGAKPDPITLRFVATLTFTGATPYDRMTTGGDIAPDGRSLVIRTYTGAYTFRVPANGKFEDAFAATPTRTQLPPQQQGEAIGFTSDGGNLVITSEGTPCPVTVLP